MPCTHVLGVPTPPFVLMCPPLPQLSLHPSPNTPVPPQVARGVHLGDLQGALADIDAVLQMDAHQHLAYFNRAILLSGQADYEAALRDYDRAVELEPTQVRTAPPSRCAFPHRPNGGFPQRPALGSGSGSGGEPRRKAVALGLLPGHAPTVPLPNAVQASPGGTHLSTSLGSLWESCSALLERRGRPSAGTRCSIGDAAIESRIARYLTISR